MDSLIRRAQAGDTAAFERLYRINVTAVSGRIGFEGGFASSGSFYFESHSGDIELSLTTGPVPAFEIISFSGDVADTLSGDSGGGRADALVKIKTFKGKVRLGREVAVGGPASPVVSLPANHLWTRAP